MFGEGLETLQPLTETSALLVIKAGGGMEKGTPLSLREWVRHQPPPKSLIGQPLGGTDRTTFGPFPDNILWP